MKTMLATLAAAAAFSTLTMPAQSAGLELGWLDCVVDKAGRIEILTSNRDVRCTYTPFPGGTPEVYSGSIDKLGLNIGATGYKLMQWKVWSIGHNAYQPGSLSGTYYGASAEATAAAGIGANVLGGGSDESFLLQPVSVQQQGGANAAVHVTRFTLASGG